MNRYRYRKGSYCYGCKTEISDMSVCSKCGASFIDGWSVFNNHVDPFSVLRDIWIEEPVKWWNPFSWNGGYWKFDGVGKRTEEHEKT